MGRVRNFLKQWGDYGSYKVARVVEIVLVLPASKANEDNVFLFVTVFFAKQMRKTGYVLGKSFMVFTWMKQSPYLFLAHSSLVTNLLEPIPIALSLVILSFSIII